MKAGSVILRAHDFRPRVPFLESPDRACIETDTDLFYEQGSISWAKKVCQRCDLRLECLAYALEHDEQGVWGGMSEKERQRMKRGRA